MNKPVLITFTGIDENCDIENLIELAAKEPRLEFGVLVRGGPWVLPGVPNSRYPNCEWINFLITRLRKERLNLALHVCGTRVAEILTRGSIEDLASSALSSFGRIQLNGAIAQTLVPAFQDFVRKRAYGLQAVITQYDANPHLREPEWAAGSSHRILFDASGGTGKVRKDWPQPVVGVQCGYAGGLGPDTMARELPRIAAAAGNRIYWIDMETGLRDSEDRFSIELASQTLERIHETEATHEMRACS